MKSNGIMTRGRLAVVLIIVILLIDQAIKIWVKTHMDIGESIHVAGDWFQLHFIENNGMAYGMQIGSKLLLSIFRLVAIILLSIYIWQQAKKKARWGYIVCLAMILAGAAGNLIDCMFYGIIFGGYAPFMMGRVVDMFYFPIIHATWPDWMPIWGGQNFTFFSPVFNFADASISVGVIVLLLFFRKELSKLSLKGERNDDVTKNSEKTDLTENCEKTEPTE